MKTELSPRELSVLRESQRQRTAKIYFQRDCSFAFACYRITQALNEVRARPLKRGVLIEVGEGI